jgi:hypothetical protein
MSSPQAKPTARQPCRTPRESAWPWPGRWGRPLLLALIALLIATGCSSHKKRYHKPGLLVTEADARRYIRKALEDPDADVRRAAIQQLAKTRHANLPVVVDGLAVAARTDPSESVRCAAVRALAELKNDEAVETVLVLLDDSAGNPTVRPAGAELRWEAMQALHAYAKDANLDPHSRDKTRIIAVTALASDPARDVRLEAAKLLGNFATPDTLRALIDGLRQRDFGVVYESERSLMRLTGKTFDRDAARWETWLNTTTRPFADRGSLDDTLEPPTAKGWWPWKKSESEPNRKRTATEPDDGQATAPAPRNGETVYKTAEDRIH